MGSGCRVELLKAGQVVGQEVLVLPPLLQGCRRHPGPHPDSPAALVVEGSMEGGAQRINNLRPDPTANISSTAESVAAALYVALGPLVEHSGWRHLVSFCHSCISFYSLTSTT
ncbi:hypothetical protein E2C01_031967 [Portunus trituberculatus]|uniref:Uncharacterized protein n=1 Tax=Portunus trituberculatus TaxID=210409 RepID=A0A5B7EU68_PORTR|nr:hypothetical protein [Portunus trituberculatus]